MYVHVCTKHKAKSNLFSKQRSPSYLVSPCPSSVFFPGGPGAEKPEELVHIKWQGITAPDSSPFWNTYTNAGPPTSWATMPLAPAHYLVVWFYLGSLRKPLVWERHSSLLLDIWCIGNDPSRAGQMSMEWLPCSWNDSVRVIGTYESFPLQLRI